MWSEAGDYEVQARMLARKFAANFKRFYDVPDSIAKAGPSQL
jgi:phosphoenolpyruvate carboxykinase (ATP)